MTYGVSNKVQSYVCIYSFNLFEFKEWAILSDDKSFSPFSTKEDSAALVVDVEGRMGGFLTGGSDFSDQTDITYATPIVALLQDMHKHEWKWPNFDVAP